ncbi:MAG: acyl-CoA/acyl-ACP dehydrogenase [Deltaproteobacteria bacterium]|nr:acyl-CoA/acyl-ACP dehydrogenase [Deltaproteobacteria bacterium]
MATLIDEDILSLKEKVSRFAGEHIAPRRDLYTCEEFPFDIWQKMAEENLLGLGIPKEFGGCGKNLLSVTAAGEALAGSGYNMGLTLSWLIHQMMARLFICGYGTKRQRELYLPPMARGEITASFAVSEPEHGAHPKHLKTSAEKKGDCFVLNGEKAYLTNGPIADLFIVHAVTGIEAERKQFTAFLVPGDAQGLERTKPVQFPFLRPSPHGGIILNNCSVPSSSIIGKEGSAYEEMALPFRAKEDVLLMGPMAGAMAGQVGLLAKAVKKEKNGIDENCASDLGELRMMVDTLRIMAYEAAGMLDSGTTHAELLSLTLYFRKVSEEFQETFASVKDRVSVMKNETLDFLTNDLVSILPIARNIAAIKKRKLGESVLS